MDNSKHDSKEKDETANFQIEILQGKNAIVNIKATNKREALDEAEKLVVAGKVDFSMIDDEYNVIDIT